MISVNTKISEYDLVREGVQWAKAERDTIVQLYSKALGYLPYNYYRTLTDEQRTKVAIYSVDSMISRLDGISLKSDQMRARFLEVLQQGVSLQALLDGLDSLLQIFTKKANVELVTQPQMREAMLAKINYYVNLVKAHMAAAMIEYESSRKITPKK